MPRPTPNQQLGPDKRFLGVVVDAALAAQLKATAQARGTTASDLVRDALAAALSPKQEKAV